MSQTEVLRPNKVSRITGGTTSYPVFKRGKTPTYKVTYLYGVVWTVKKSSES